MKLSIRTKLISCFVLILVIVAIMAWPGVIAMRGIINELQENITNNLKPERLISEANVSLIKWNRSLLNHALSEDLNSMYNYEEIMLKEKNNILDNLQQLSQIKYMPEKEKEYVQIIEDDIQLAIPIQVRIVTLSRQGLSNEAYKTINAEFRPFVNKIDSVMVEIVKLQTIQFEETVKIAEIESHQHIVRVYIIVCAAILLVIMVGIYFSNTVLIKMTKLIEGAKFAAAGDFQKAKVSLRAKDEFGYLGDVYNQMLVRIERNTTELKRSEEALKEYSERLEEMVLQRTRDLQESESRLRTITQAAQDAVIMTGSKGEIIFWNPAAVKMFGYSAQEAIGHDLHLLIAPPRYHEDYLKGFKKFQSTGKGAAVGKTLELEALHKNGYEFPIEISLSAIQAGNEWHSVGIVRDIAERQKAMTALRESEERYRVVFERAGDYVLMLDLDQEMIPVIMDANEAALSLHGYSREEMIGKPITLLDQEMTPEMLLERKRLLDEEGGGIILARHNRKDGTGFDVEAHLQIIQIGDKNVLLSIERDVTGQKQAEEALKVSEERYRRVIENINDVIYSISPSGELTFISGACEKLFGVPAEVITGRNINDLASMVPVSPEDFKKSNELFYEAVSKGLDSLSFEFTFKKQEGEIHLEIKQNIQYDDSGNVLGSFGVIRDITKRKSAEAALRESEARYRALFAGSTDGILIADIETRKFIFANPAICRMLGYSEEEMLTKFVPDIHPKESLEYVISVFEAHARGDMSLTSEVPCLRSDGKIIYAKINTSKIIIGERECNVGFFTDVTEQKQLEEQFRQSQKMESIGRLAGGVAHDFNNLLTVITGHTDMALMALDPNDPLCEDLEEIQKSAERASNLTRQLLAFSRKQTLQPKVLNLNKIIQDLDKMLRRIIGEDIALETVAEQNLWNVKVDPGQIEQVIVNLVVNARDAMPQGGKLTIETLNVNLDEEYCRTHATVKPGKNVMLAVSDTGIGMTKEVKEQIFDPFFTTKETGRGTGLGLSTVYGIVKQSDGHIWVYSELGKGTSVKIYLPMVLGEAEEIVRKVAFDKMPEGSETVLVVEDEDAVRDMVVRVLTQQGYQVIEAQSGGDAYILCQKLEKPVDLVVTDVIMPNMSGNELVDHLRNLFPDFKVLFMSGYTANAIVHNGILDAKTPYLQKPFRPKDLAIKVREVLDK